MSRPLHQKITAFPFIIFTIICLYCNLATSSEDFNIRTICLGNSITNRNFTYQNNVDSLLSKLSSESSNNARPPLPGFFNTTVGDQVPEKAYGTYLCRGDLDTQLCHNCVINVTRALSKEDKSYECFGFDDQCIVHYADHSIYSVYKKGIVLSYGTRGGVYVGNYQLYNKTVSATLERLVGEATLGNWTTTNFETRVADVVGSDDKIYTLVQCSPDLSALNCSACLGDLYSYISRCCSVGTPGAYVIHANCMIKYSNHSFFGGDHAQQQHSWGYQGFMAGYHVYLLVFLSIYFLFNM